MRFSIIIHVGTCGDSQTSGPLTRVPAALTAELQGFADYRMSPLQRQRDGSAVVDITLSADRRTCLAFLGYLSAEHDIQPGLGDAGDRMFGTK